MKNKANSPCELPTIDQLTAELDRTKYKRRYNRVLRSTIYTLIVVAAVAVLIATIWMPVLQIYGASMAPTLDEGDIVISVKGSDFEAGDLVAFYMGNKILVKRCIAGPGQWVDIDDEGNVYVDGELLDEPYLAEKALGAAGCASGQRRVSARGAHAHADACSAAGFVGRRILRQGSGDVWIFPERAAAANHRREGAGYDGKWAPRDRDRRCGRRLGEDQNGRIRRLCAAGISGRGVKKK